MLFNITCEIKSRMLNFNLLNVCERCVINKFRYAPSRTIINCFYSTKTKVKVVENKQRPLITCKRKEFNFYPGQKVGKLDEIKLASKGWYHRKSNGDYFILHISDKIETQNFETSFAKLGLNNKLISNLETNGLLTPTLIQSKALPILLSGQNSLIAAETGCGKTLAYLLPLITQIIQLKTRHESTVFNAPKCLILTPSRELAFQIENVAKHLLKDLNISTDVIVGGGTKRKMLNPSFKETDLLVATLGALSKLTTTGIYKMRQVRHVVLDEADTLLDESFSEKLAHFLKRFPFRYTGDVLETLTGTQLTLVSATMPTQLPEIVANIIVPESLVRITTDQLHRILPHVPQRFLRIGPAMKPPQLLQIVKANCDKGYPVMIFSNKTATCDWISMFLNENGVNCINLNGDMSLQLRNNKFIDFQRGDINVISCTDVASRGLDTTRVKHVINYEFPKFTADYVHRCGRTGRIGSPINCHVTSFISGLKEVDLVQKIELTVRKQECLPNVNGNIAGIIKDNIMRNINEDFKDSM